ncbi:hypothetical protein JX265_002988 [Neoarthrinium moseri]|uniref:Uncharacterized protein n=1 Tax=Neoarthrinium moseri TaxID=1658444 RepID=A0A9P9WT18_9PEZI|nr:uncharacterized protein JN550_006082 [Neoarthrinium moseri]KAI1869095.1 hypothetical protein JN550_006082 [Neoarthrinium moseri]KAI1878811.1 hypothetical protein JX265_002988 [Neoarthrinium moseri]
MGSFSRTQSPVLAMPPSAAHQPAFGMPMYSLQSSPLSRPGPFCPSARPQPPVQPSFPRSAGRKRSRDEAAINLDVEEAKLETIEPVKEAEDEWVYGEGMVLIKKSQAYVADAGSQSGTWLEEKAAAEEKRRNEEARAIHQQERPSLRSNKSQRLDMSSVSIPALGSHLNRSSPVRDVNDTVAAAPALAVDGSSQPVIDNFTLHLGIGWSRINTDEHRQAAARGWARYIENHFPINNVQIQLESKGLQSYLVEASEGFFLFAEDLQKGQFISSDLNQTFQNLKASPPVFEGLEVMTAAGTPQPTPSQDVEMMMT